MGGGGGWKDVVGGWGRKKDGSEQAQLAEGEGGGTGREGEVEGGSLGGAVGGDRMEGVKRNAKLNNVRPLLFPLDPLFHPN